MKPWKSESQSDREPWRHAKRVLHSSVNPNHHKSKQRGPRLRNERSGEAIMNGPRYQLQFNDSHDLGGKTIAQMTMTLSTWIYRTPTAVVSMLSMSSLRYVRRLLVEA